MKKIFLILGAALFCSTLYAFDLSVETPGIQVSSVPGAKISDHAFIHIQRPDRPVDGIVELNERKELVFRPEPGKSTGKIGVMLQLPAKVSRVKITFEMKGVNFFVSRKIKDFNRFMFYIGGVNLMLRGNAYGLRNYDVERKTYVHAVDFNNNVWKTVTIDMFCGAKPVYSLNNKKNIIQRGKCEWINRLIFYCDFVNASADTALYIRNLKIELPDD